MILTKPDGRTTEITFGTKTRGMRADKILFTEHDVKAARIMRDKQGQQAVESYIGDLIFVRTAVSTFKVPHVSDLLTGKILDKQ